MPVMKGLDPHSLLLLLLQLATLLAVARGLGEVMRRFQQPMVVGELLAGVVLGPSVLGAVLPGVQGALFPPDQHQADLLAVVGWIGVLFLLVVTGLETDLRLIVKKGRTAMLISAGGIVVPFATGIGVGFALPDSFLPRPEERTVFALFLAVAMSISAIPVIAKVLFDLRLTRRDIGQLTLAAAMTDDTVGWILLSVVAGLAERGVVDVKSVALSVAAAVGFLAVGLTVGAWLVAGLVGAVDRAGGGETSQISLVLVLALGAAAFTHHMGVEAVLGAFVVGIAVGQARRFRKSVAHTLESVTAGVLAPIFFASAGLKVDLARFLDREVLVAGAVVLAVACLGKLVGCYVGAWVGGLRHWERVAMGSGMNARGAMEIIVATVGLSLGVLTHEMYSIVVMVAIVTSVMAPPLLRWSLGHVEIGETEAKRLEDEAIAARSFARSIRRVLVLARDEQQATLATAAVSWLTRAQPLETTACYANVDDPPARAWRIWAWDAHLTWVALRARLRVIQDLVRGLRGGKGRVAVATGPQAYDEVVAELSRGFDLVVTAVDRAWRRDGLLFGRVIDRVVRDAPCASLVLRAGPGATAFATTEAPPRLARVLVPTGGTAASREAVELAAVIAQGAGAVLVVLHVLSSSDGDEALARGVLEEQVAAARKLGANVEGRLVTASSVEDGVLHAAEEGVDLLVLGTSVRGVQQRAFLGERTEAVLTHAPCAVAVLTTRTVAVGV